MLDIVIIHLNVGAQKNTINVWQELRLEYLW